MRSDRSRIVLNAQVPEATILHGAEGGNACERLDLAGAVQSEQAGYPQLPVIPLLLGVPPGVDVALHVQEVDTSWLGGDHVLCPAPEVSVQQDSEGSYATVVRSVNPNSTVYESDRFYPAEAASLEELGFVRSQRIVRLLISPLQWNPVTGMLRQHRRLHVELEFAGGSERIGRVEESEELEAALGRLLLNYDEARAWRATEPSLSAWNDSSVLAWWTPPVPAVKIHVNQAGVYELDRADLAASIPVQELDPRTLQLFAGGEEIAIDVSGEEDGRFDEGDSLLFYGTPADTKYTGTNIYWLTYGDRPGLRMEQRASQTGGELAASYTASAEISDNLVYLSSLPMRAGANHWYGARIQASGLSQPGHVEYTLELDHLANASQGATLQASLGGHFDGWHHLLVYVNGHQVIDDRWFGRSLFTADALLDPGLLVAGANAVRVELANDTPGQTVDMAYVDWLRVSFRRPFISDGQTLAFGGDESGDWQYCVAGFAQEPIDLFDVSDPQHPVRISGALTTPDVIGSGSSTVCFGDSHEGQRRYLAWAAQARLEPERIEMDTPSDLRNPAQGADYVIISPTEFLGAVQPLAQHREQQGLRVQVVDVQDIYDEFGQGLMSAEAIRDFLAYAYDRWTEPPPRYALLVGDGTYDPRGYLSTSGPTFIPAYLELVDPELGEAAADNRYGCVAGDDILPDVSVGRLPVNTAAEARSMVDKVLGYEATQPTADWRRRVLFVTDNLEGGGGNFYALSDGIADGYRDPPTDDELLLPGDYIRHKIYLGQTCPSEQPSLTCRRELVDTLNTDGALLMSYIGHATREYWARERLLDYSALQMLTNSDRLPISLAMTCLEGFFHEPQMGSACLGEALVRQPVGGAVASWSPTGLGVATGHDLLERGFFLALFDDGVAELGPATNQAKLYLLAKAPPGKYRDLVDTYLVLGDPALRLQLAPGRVYVPLLWTAAATQ